MNLGMGKQLEIFPRFIENVPDYEKKLLAWEYLNLSNEEKGVFLKDIFPGDNRYKSPVTASLALNNKAKFPLTEPVISSGLVVPRGSKELMEYCKDILDKHGELLPSKYQQKAA